MEFIKISTKNHFVGSRLDVFSQNFIEKLEEYMHNSEFEASDEEPSEKAFKPAALLSYPNKGAKDGFKLVVVRKEEELAFGSMFAFIKDIGRIYEGEFATLYVWENGVEAQVELNLNFSQLVFYDMSFVQMRAFYTPNSKIKARVYAVAYRANVVEDSVIEIEVNEQNQAAFSDKKIGEKVGIHTGQMRQFIGGVDEMDYDEYQLRGKVSAVRKIRLESFEKEAFVCTIDALYDGDEEFYYFDVLITEEVWQSDSLPQIDSFISVYGYFCGELLLLR